MCVQTRCAVRRENDVRLHLVGDQKCWQHSSVAKESTSLMRNCVFCLPMNHSRLYQDPRNGRETEQCFARAEFQSSNLTWTADRFMLANVADRTRIPSHFPLRPIEIIWILQNSSIDSFTFSDFHIEHSTDKTSSKPFRLNAISNSVWTLRARPVCYQASVVSGALSRICWDRSQSSLTALVDSSACNRRNANNVIFFNLKNVCVLLQSMDNCFYESSISPLNGVSFVG